MAQRWIQSSGNTLKKLRQLLEAPNQDRLYLVWVIRFALGALNRSLAGWTQWTKSAEIMSNLTREELEEMTKNLTGMVENFIDYDIKVMEDGVRKGLPSRGLLEGAIIVV